MTLTQSKSPFDFTCQGLELFSLLHFIHAHNSPLLSDPAGIMSGTMLMHIYPAEMPPRLFRLKHPLGCVKTWTQGVL